MKHSHPIFAAVYDRLLESTERAFLGTLRADLLKTARGKVLEVGAGTGGNFRYYPGFPVCEVLAVEPDPHMRRRAEQRVAGMNVSITVADGTAESLPVSSASIDTLVSTLVLCSVENPEAAVEEWRRVLRPGGSVLFIEHLRSEHSRRAWCQDLITPLWRRIAANCHPNRSTLATIRRAGFEIEEKERVQKGAPWTQPIVAAVARFS